jgi:tRNA threonylcarbamoyladenosine biosynthesis protein TsaB
MKILAFDTSGPVLSLALETPKGRYAVIRDTGLRHGELLASLVQQICSDAETSIQDLDLIVCARGPGSFTGLRIGMSLAKGLSAGSGVPVVSIPVPDILVRPYSFCAFPVIPVIDARKGRFYGACYTGGIRQSEYFDLSAMEIIRRYHTSQGILIAGPDAELFKSRLPVTENVSFAPFSPTAVFDMLILGPLQLDKQGPDAPAQGPLYIRKSEAELGMEKGNGE